MSGLNILGISVLGIKQQVLSLLHQVLIYGTVVLLQLRQFWNILWTKLATEDSYTTNIEGMRMKLSKLQDDDKKIMKLRSERLPEGWENIE